MNTERSLPSSAEAALAPLRFTLSDAEHHQVHALATRLLQRQLLKGNLLSATLRITLLVVVVLGVASVASSSLPAAWRNVLALAAGVALLGGLVWRQHTQLRQITRERLGDDFVVVLSDIGLRVGAALGLTTYVWTALQKAEIEGAFVLVHLRGAMVLPIPVRAFAGHANTPHETATAFVNTINARIQAAGGPVQSTTVSPSQSQSAAAPQASISQASISFARALARNVRAGFQLLFLRSSGLASLQPGIGQLALLLLLFMLMSLGADVIEVGLNGRLQWHGLHAALVFIVVCLTTAWAAALWGSEGLEGSEGSEESEPAHEGESRPPLLQGVVALAALSLAFGVFSEIYEADTRARWVVGWITQNFASEHAAQWAKWWMWWAPWMLWLWFALAAAIAMARHTRTHGLRQWGAGLSALLAATLMSWSLGNSPALWVASVDPADASERAARWQSPATEAVLYRQPQLLQEALQAIAPGKPGTPELYYIGLAGAGYQDVFVNEVESVEKLLQQHFGTQGRGVLLANAMRTPMTRPFASVTALAKTLETVAQRMNVDEDVLFLFMTSHGSRKHEFEIELWPYRFESITPQRLRELLDASGIRHRVIVVSACYSGGFVPALTDDDTLVITASRADRTSFGCEDGRDWTAFGQAYFAEALAAQPSFERAFQLATAKIAERERQENRTPSEPQIAVGAKIRQQLRLIEPVSLPNSSPNPQPETSP